MASKKLSWALAVLALALLVGPSLTNASPEGEPLLGAEVFTSKWSFKPFPVSSLHGFAIRSISHSKGSIFSLQSFADASQICHVGRISQDAFAVKAAKFGQYIHSGDFSSKSLMTASALVALFASLRECVPPPMHASNEEIYLHSLIKASF